MPAHPANWLIGQKACGCATVTLICLKACRAEAGAVAPVANKPGDLMRNWLIKRFQDAGVTSLRNIENH
eukprot:611600-Pleurochrysis_carterae.AAC.2